MLVGCGMMTTSVPTMITAGLTGTLPGASDYRSTSGVWSQPHASIGRMLLSDSGSSAASGTCSQRLTGAEGVGGGGGGVLLAASGICSPSLNTACCSSTDHRMRHSVLLIPACISSVSCIVMLQVSHNYSWQVLNLHCCLLFMA